MNSHKRTCDGYEDESNNEKPVKMKMKKMKKITLGWSLLDTTKVTNLHIRCKLTYLPESLN